MSMSEPTKELEESTSSLSTTSHPVNGSGVPFCPGPLLVSTPKGSVSIGCKSHSTTSISEKVDNNRLEKDA